MMYLLFSMSCYFYMENKGASARVAAVMICCISFTMAGFAAATLVVSEASFSRSYSSGGSFFPSGVLFTTAFHLPGAQPDCPASCAAARRRVCSSRSCTHKIPSKNTNALLPRVSPAAGRTTKYHRYPRGFNACRIANGRQQVPCGGRLRGNRSRCDLTGPAERSAGRGCRLRKDWSSALLKRRCF